MHTFAGPRVRIVPVIGLAHEARHVQPHVVARPRARLRGGAERRPSTRCGWLEWQEFARARVRVCVCV